MTTLTVEINKDKDLLALKEFIGQLGLKYEIEENGALLYTDEVKKTLDNRYSDYKAGNVIMISAEESKKRVQALLEKNK